MQGLCLCPRLPGCGRRQTLTPRALPRVEVVGDGLDIRRIRLAIPLTDKLQGTVVGKPASEAALEGVALLGCGAGADIRKEYLDAGDRRHNLTRPVGARVICQSMRSNSTTVVSLLHEIVVLGASPTSIKGTDYTIL